MSEKRRTFHVGREGSTRPTLVTPVDMARMKTGAQLDREIAEALASNAAVRAPRSEISKAERAVLDNIERDGVFFHSVYSQSGKTVGTRVLNAIRSLSAKGLVKVTSESGRDTRVHADPRNRYFTQYKVTRASSLNESRGHATKKDASEISDDLGDLAAAIRKERARGHLGPNRVHLNFGSRSNLYMYGVGPRSASILMRSEKHRETLRQLLGAASIQYRPSEYRPASGGMHSKGFVKQYTSPARRDPASIVILWDGA